MSDRRHHAKSHEYHPSRLLTVPADKAAKWELNSIAFSSAEIQNPTPRGEVFFF